MAEPDKTGLIEDPSASTRGVLAFFTAALLGTGFIVFAKLLAWTQAQVTAVPIIILLVYAFILYRWRRLSLRDDQSGDNLYYLGFLYTLTSIAVSLYQFGLDEKQEQIITNFGIAISTTIVGLALRVMFNQMRQDPAEVERIARLELADAARRLRRELDDIVTELNVFQRIIQQSLTDGQRSVQELLQGTVGKFEVLSKGLSGISNSAILVDKELSDFSKQLAELRAPEVIVKLEVEPALRQLQTLIEEARANQMDSAAGLDAAAGAIESAAVAIRGVTEATFQLIEEKNAEIQYRRNRAWWRPANWVRRESVKNTRRI